MSLSPASRVYNTFELLGQILSYLPIKDILNVQLTSKRVQPVIDGTPKLQPNLFLQQMPAPAYLRFQFGADSDNGDSAFVYLAGSVSRPLDPGYTSHITRPIGIVHPALGHGEPLFLETEAYFGVDRVMSWPAAGKWRDTLVTQPPSQDVHIAFGCTNYGCKRCDPDDGFALSDVRGVRLGALRDELARKLPMISRHYHNVARMKVRGMVHAATELLAKAQQHPRELEDLPARAPSSWPVEFAEVVAGKHKMGARMAMLMNGRSRI